MNSDFSNVPVTFMFLSEDEVVSDLLQYKLTGSQKRQIVTIKQDEISSLHDMLGGYIRRVYRFLEDGYPYLNGMTPVQKSYKICIRIWEILSGKTYVDRGNSSNPSRLNSSDEPGLDYYDYSYMHNADDGATILDISDDDQYYLYVHGGVGGDDSDC